MFKIIKPIIVLLFVSFWLTTSAEATKKITISGSIIDTITRQPIEFASVAVYKMTDNSLVNGTITNSKGEFVFELPPASYIVKSSFVGYKSKTVSVDFTNASTGKIEPIELSNVAISLNEVKVTGNKTEKQMSIEKTKINVSQNISSVSGSITDVLKNQSSISIDAENNIYLRGNSNILILLDGRPTTVTSLGSLPSANVENIEVITNPDAKYDAEGTGGIINIVTKKQNTNGLNGVITLNFGFNNRLNGGVDLNYTKGIWAVGFNYNGRYEKSTINSHLTRQLYAQNTLIDQDVYSLLSNPTHVLGATLTAKPNNRNLFSFSLKSVIFDNVNNQNIDGTQNNDGSQDILFKRKNEITWSRRNIDAALSYKRIFEKNKHEISFDAMYSITKGARTGNYEIEDVYLQKSDAGGTPTNITIQTDYFKQLYKTGRVEFGLKAFSRWNSFTSHFYDKDVPTNQWIINPTYSNDLEYKEYIYSSYLMYSDTLMKKIYYKIGARVEYNTSELVQKSTNENINKKYLFPFPFLLLKYPISSTQNIALSLTRRVTRPIYSQLNPYIIVIDQITYETGNQHLIPEISDKLELNHSWVKDKVQIRSNLYYGITNDFITQVSLLSSNNLILTYVNGNKQIKTGLDFDANYKMNKVFSVNPTFSVFYTKSNGKFNEIDLGTKGIAWTGNLKFSVNPDIKTDFQFLLNYNSPIDLPQFKLNEIYYADFAVKRTFLKNKLALSFTVSDVFNTRQWVINTENSAYKLYNKSKNDTRIFWVGIKYNFNAYKSSNGQKSEVENDGSLIKLGQ
jgi:outer membrane receptor protein involved in Fe transport